MLDKLFHLKTAGTTVQQEVVGGVTTFMALSYIIFVQPAVLSACGMDMGAVMLATCISSAIATIMMALYANYPIALAPAMGHNFFFAYTVCGPLAAGGLGYTWQEALGAVFISGTIFIILSLFGFREFIVNVIPDSLKYSIAVGIGLLIAFTGFEWAGIVVGNPATYVGLGNIKSPPVLLSIFGLLLMIVLLIFKVRGAIIIGLIAAALGGWLIGLTEYHGIISLPKISTPAIMKLNILGLFTKADFLTIIFVFFFLDLFDTIGTLVGVSEQAGFMKKGKLPRARQALLSDAVGTVSGAMLGTSTVTSYIESAAGVAVGARTGLANIITAFLMLISLLFYPLMRMVGGEIQLSDGVIIRPIIAPALIIVGSFMLKGISKLKWDDFTEVFPAFITIMVMPLAFSITEGIAMGFIALSFCKLVSGRLKEVHWLIHLFSVLFIIRYILT
jgi:AGZA family xanthine/uracil permease-like MFS transporter